MRTMPTACLTAFFIAVSQESAAQVTTDGSLGPAQDMQGPDIRIDEALGQGAGNNLFHSFERFNVETGGRVTFEGRASIENVIARVTGGEISSIDGTIASNIPSANLWLMNPAGFLFGPNASLDIPGALHVTTTDELSLGSDGLFAVDLAKSSELSVAAPSAFGFLGTGQGRIEVSGSSLQSADAQAISLTGQSINIEAASISGRLITATAIAIDGDATINAESGEIEGDGRGPITISDNSIFGGFEAFETSIIGSDVQITDSNVSAGASRISTLVGGLTLDAEDLRITGLSQIAVGNPSDDPGGDLTLRAPNIMVEGGAQIFNSSLADGASGKVSVEADVLAIENAFIQNISSQIGNGGAGEFEIVVDELSLKNNASVGSLTLGEGNAGSVSIQAERIEIGAASLITSGTVSSGDGGVIGIEVGEIIIDRGSPTAENSAIVTNSALGADGNAGSIVLSADSVVLRNGAEISSSSRGSGSAGLILLDAREVAMEQGGFIASITTADGPSLGMLLNIDDLRIEGLGEDLVSGISTQSTPDSTQDAGVVILTAGTIDLRNGASIDSSSFGAGNAAAVFITAEDIRVENSLIASITKGAGDAGFVQLTTGTLSILRTDQGVRSAVSTQSAPGSSGSSGAVLIQADSVLIDGDNSSIESASFSDMPAGGVVVAADDIEMRNGAVIVSSGQATGAAGDIGIETVNLSIENSGISTQGVGAQGGRIAIVATERALLREGAIVSSGIIPVDDASLIRIESDEIILDRSRVLSLVGDDNTIRPDTAIVFGEARLIGDLTVISQDSEVAAATTIEIRGLDSEIGNNLTLPTVAIVDTGRLLTGDCASQGAGNASSFRAENEAVDSISPFSTLGSSTNLVSTGQLFC